MAKPKLCLIPATIGDKVYSILPSDGVGDFDFDRADGSSPTGVTRINAQGLIEQVASGVNRLNYSLLDGEVVGCPHLLLEPARTNLIQYSEDFSQWTAQNQPTVVVSSELAPNGIIGAYDITDDRNNAFEFVRSNDISFNGTYTASIFIRKTLGALSHYAGLEICLAGSYLIINTTDGSINQTLNAYSNIKSEDFGNWWRVSATATGSNSGSILQVWSAISSNGTSISSSATGTNTFWGAQVEQGSYPTSYIKTDGSQNTRAAETCNGSGNAATFNDSEGVLMAEISDFNNDSFRQLSISSGSGDNAVSIMNTTTENQLVCFVNSGSVTQASISTILNSTHEFNKIAMLYKANDFQLWVNGIKVDTDPIGIPPSGLNTLNFDSGTGSSPFYGKNKQIQYFDSILDSEQLEQLTSWDSFRAMAEGQLYTIE
jgi:hypothetical protein